MGERDNLCMCDQGKPKGSLDGLHFLSIEIDRDPTCLALSNHSGLRLDVKRKGICGKEAKERTYSSRPGEHGLEGVRLQKGRIYGPRQHPHPSPQNHISRKESFFLTNNLP